MPAVIRIFTAPKAGAWMEARTSVEVIPGLGLAGDRYAMQQGSWKAKGESTHKKKRNVTFFDAASLRRGNRWLNNRNLKTFSPEETRRNILVGGIDVLSLVGKRFFVDTVEFLGVEHAEPCDRPNKLADKRCFAEAFEGMGGLNAIAVTGGIILQGSILRLR